MMHVHICRYRMEYSQTLDLSGAVAMTAPCTELSTSALQRFRQPSADELTFAGACP